jgi:hypothetical protein
MDLQVGFHSLLDLVLLEHKTTLVHVLVAHKMLLENVIRVLHFLLLLKINSSSLNELLRLVWYELW